MALVVLRQIKKALSALNPRELRESADQRVRVGLVGASPESLGRMETYFAPPHFTPDRRAEATQILVRGGGLGCDVEIYDSSLLRPARAFSFDPDEPEACVRRILRCR